MKTKRSFAQCDRYKFDFDICSPSKGWAQVDTDQDASYFGTWANPSSLEIMNYCEGDITHQTADTGAEFLAELEQIKAWNDDQGGRFLGIDPMLNAGIELDFRELGAGHLLH